MAFASATHDIAADGFYMLGLDQHSQAFFVGIRSTFYRIANLFGQGVLIMIAGNLQVLARNGITFSWALVFYGTAGLMIALWLWHGYILPKPAEDKPKEDERACDILKGVADTIRTFFTKAPARTVVTAILFMLLYRMPEGLLVKISTLFLIDGRSSGGLGIAPQELGMVQGTVGVIGLTLGGILGGMAAGRHGLRRWLWPMVCAITLPNLVYVYMSYALPESLFIVNVCVFIEQFGYGFGFTAYMLYLIYFCQGEYKTSHYALCTAFMALSMMIPGLFAGALQQAVGYQTFFLVVMAACAITFLVTAFIDVDPRFGRKAEEA